MDESNKFVTLLIDYIFWGLIILYTNPGGIVQAFNAHDVIGKIDINDFLFVLLSFCFIIIPKRNNYIDRDFKKIKIWLFIFLIYYFVFHAFIVPILNNNESYTLLNSLIKSRHNLYYILIFIYIYHFFTRRIDIFTKIFAYSSVVILTIFLLQLIININILPIFSLNRSFIDIERNIMMSEGIISLLVPMGVALIIFKPKIKYKNIILLGFALFPIYAVISLKRREMLSIIIYFFIAFLIYMYITDKHKKVFIIASKVTLLLTALIIGSYFIFPKYTVAAGVSLIETINILESGKTSTGEADERLGLNKTFIVDQFKKHPLFGTGFDNRWRNDVGQKQGYESSDYPLLAAFARYGILGILVFIPVYLIIILMLKTDLKYLKNIRLKNNNLYFLFLMTFILFFVFHLLQYFNWFYAISSNAFYYWYFFLAFYLAVRYKFYLLQNQNNSIKTIHFFDNIELLTHQVQHKV